MSVATGPFRPGGVIRGTVTIDGDACRVSIDLRRCDLAHGTKLHRPASATHLIEAGPDVETPFALENFGTGARTREDAPDEPMTDTLSEVTAKIGNIGCAGQGVTIVPVRKG